MGRLSQLDSSELSNQGQNLLSSGVSMVELLLTSSIMDQEIIFHKPLEVIAFGIFPSEIPSIFK